MLTSSARLGRITTCRRKVRSSPRLFLLLGHFSCSRYPPAILLLLLFSLTIAIIIFLLALLWLLCCCFLYLFSHLYCRFVSSPLWTLSIWMCLYLFILVFKIFNLYNISSTYFFLLFFINFHILINHLQWIPEWKISVILLIISLL